MLKCFEHFKTTYRGANSSILVNNLEAPDAEGLLKLLRRDCIKFFKDGKKRKRGAQFGSNIIHYKMNVMRNNTV